MDALTRAATRADIPAITAIYDAEVAYGTASFEIVPPQEDEMARRITMLGDGGYPCVVAERAGTVIGYGYAGSYRPRPAYRHTVEDSIYIDGNCRGQGIGGLLLRVLIEQATAAGFRQMVAVIGDSQNMASVRLHHAAGFAMVGTLKSVGYKHGRWLDTVLMQRALGAGDKAAPER